MAETIGTMAEIIQIREYQAARERARNRGSDQVSLERAGAIMRENLAAAAARLANAPPQDQPELLDRVEKLAAMVRYAMRMMDDRVGSPVRGE
ncbi:MAG TPA: hypothetical protein VJ718_04675 [Candidatus Binataceae bacterium]|jgi:hypothetical protein|nr:hypothetical protein [Candidatus Binataceae bacterium]